MLNEDIRCNWTGHNDGEMYTTEVCTKVYTGEQSWLHLKTGLVYCPDHAVYVCKLCYEPNLDTVGCPDTKSECIDCCGDITH